MSVMVLDAGISKMLTVIKETHPIMVRFTSDIPVKYHTHKANLGVAVI